MRHIQKTNTIKENTDNCNYMKSRHFDLTKETVNEVQRQIGKTYL